MSKRALRSFANSSHKSTEARNQESESMAPRVVVVGGGISGLAAAYDLTRAGVDCTVFERNTRPGGVIETRCWQDCRLDCGPDSFISAKPEALALIRELGIEDQVIGSNDDQRTTYILKNGRLIALPEGIMMMVPTKVMPMVRTRLLSWGTKLRMARELLRRPREYPDRSVAEFVVDHFGEETLDYLAEPLLSGVYGGDPRQLSAASVLPRFVEMERRQGSLSRAAMRSTQTGPRGPLFKTDRVAGGRYRIRANGGEIETDHVILAVPAWEASRLLGEIEGELAALLGQIPYSSSAIVSLIYEQAGFDGMRAGFGFLVPKRERQRLAACTFVNTKFAFRAPANRMVLRCFFGGIDDAGVLAESDESLVEIARQELRRILNLQAAPVYHTIARWPRSMAQYTVGHAARVREIQARSAAIPGLHLAGNAYEGIGIPDCIRTGRAAARRIIGSGIVDPEHR
jgi:oxygen-dependent protoporphyrinogen oxidase